MTANTPAIFAQVLGEHPQGGGHWPAPTRAGDGSDEPDLGLLRQVTKNAEPKVKVGLRGFRSNYAKALFRGRFT